MSRFLLKCLSKILKIVYHLLYHEFSWTYDGVASVVSAGLWNEWVRSCLDLAQGDPILELGYGPGHLQVAAINRGDRIFGIDESASMCRQASRRIRRECSSGGQGQRLVRGLSQALPYPADHFATIFSTFPSEYAFDPHTISEVKRVLTPGGRWVILITARPSGSGPSSLFQRLLTWVYTSFERHFEASQELWKARIDENISVQEIQLPESALMVLIYTRPAGGSAS